MFYKPVTRFFSVLFLALALTACHDDNAGIGADSNAVSEIGTINLYITDAPIDSAAKVVVSFSGVSIKPNNGPAFDIDFVDDNNLPIVKSIDLLSQQWPDSEPLLVDHVLVAGHYNWIRLKVVASETSTDSYIELDDGSQHPLYIPSGNQTGLKLVRGFDISVTGATSLTIDFDLRKSVLMPNGNSLAYKLQPALRIVDNSNVGHIKGVVGAVTLNHIDCTGSDYAVYVYAGDNIIPDDVDGIEPDPIKTSFLSNSFQYAVGFLDAGVYTISFTCEANNDNNETDDVITFIGTDSVTVNAGETTIYNFD
jgi:hypothetical protein